MTGPFKPCDFEASFGITEVDLQDYVGDSDLRWIELCQRATDAANVRFAALFEVGYIVFGSIYLAMLENRK